MNKKLSIQRISAMILSLVMVISTNTTTFASDFDGSGNGGGGSGGSAGNYASSTWSQDQQGYRFYIIDIYGNRVSNVVDILLSDHRLGNVSTAFKNSREESLSDKGLNGWEVHYQGGNGIAALPVGKTGKAMFNDANIPKPLDIIGENTFISNGAKFRKWFMGDHDGTNMSSVASSTGEQGYTSSSKTYATSSGGKAEVMEYDDIRTEAEMFVKRTSNEVMLDSDKCLDESTDALNASEPDDINNANSLVESSTKFAQSIFTAEFVENIKSDTEVDGTADHTSSALSAIATSLNTLKVKLEGDPNLNSAQVTYIMCKAYKDLDIYVADSVDNLSLDVTKQSEINKSESIKMKYLENDGEYTEFNYEIALDDTKYADQMRQNYGKFLNYVYPSGKRLFHWDPKYNIKDIRDAGVPVDENKNPNYNTIQTMAFYNLALVVEPITWLAPCGWFNGFYNATSQMIYGTHYNLYQWLSQGSNSQYADYYYDASTPKGVFTGGAYVNVFRLGWQCMISEHDYPAYQAGTTLNTGVQATNLSTVMGTMHGAIATRHAISMHIYTATRGDNTDAGISTYDHNGATPSSAPDPTTSAGTPESKIINIVKFYEKEVVTDDNESMFEDDDYDELDSDIDIERSNYTRKLCPGSIIIENEALNDQMYIVEDWFIDGDTEPWADYGKGVNSTPAGQEKIYDEIKTSSTSRRSKNDEGETDGGTIGNKIEDYKPVYLNYESNEITLYVKLVATDDTSIIDDAGNYMILNQSEISKAYDTDTLEDAHRDLKFTQTNPAESSHTISYKVGHGDDRHTVHATCNYKCISDRSFTFKNTAQIDKYLIGDNSSDIFKSKYVRDEGEAVGKGWNKIHDWTMKKFHQEFIIHRGHDRITLAEYKKDANTDEVSSLVENRVGNVPESTRERKGYMKVVHLQWEMDNATGVYEVDIKHSHSKCKKGIFTGNITELSEDKTDPMNLQASIKVYSGRTRSAGQETSRLEKNLIPITGMSNYSGVMVQSSKNIEFYPYINMTYQKTGDYTTKKDVAVLSDWCRVVLPNDYAELGWSTPNSAKNSLSLTSKQWSLHARATSGSEKWQGKNQVLPGGALYNIGINESNQPSLILNTWQTILYGETRSIVESQSGSLGTLYTVDEAKKAHTSYLNSVINSLEHLNMVQWVNPNSKVTNAWDAGGVKVSTGGQSLTGLASKKSSTEDKYYLNSDTSEKGDNLSSGEADLDVVKKGQSIMYFKVYSDTKGDVYFAQGNDLASLETSKGDKLFDKKVTWKKVDENLTDGSIVKELNKKTYFITNYVKSIERNSGSDTSATWAADGKWYNEAFDGMYMMLQSDKLTVNLGKVNQRSAALDPNLTPKNVGISDLFSKAYASQFRLDVKSSIHTDKGDEYVGSFKGKNIYLDDMENMLQSKIFYIPNVNVQDLVG